MSKKWGTFARSEVRPGEATVAIRTEVENQGKGAQQTARHLDYSRRVRQSRGKEPRHPAQSIGEWGEHVFEQQVVVKSPALWSLEQRNQYKLVTEIEAGGAITDRYETPFGIRTCTSTPRRAFS